jgi:hypothetical protein
MKALTKIVSYHDDVAIQVLNDLDDLSKNIFMRAMLKARETCGGSQCELSRRLGLELRRTQKWFAKNIMPPYETAKMLYPKLLAIIEKGQK